MCFVYVCCLLFDVVKRVIDVGINFIGMMYIYDRSFPFHYRVNRNIFMHKPGVKMIFCINEFERGDQEPDVKIKGVTGFHYAVATVIFNCNISILRFDVDATFALIVP